MNSLQRLLVRHARKRGEIESSPSQAVRRHVDALLDDQLVRPIIDRVCGSSSVDSVDAAKRLTTLLLNWEYLEAKALAGLATGLVRDFAAALAVLPRDWPQRQVLEAIGAGLRETNADICRNPAALFQCLHNALIETDPEPRSIELQNSLHDWLECWRDEKNAFEPGFRWLRRYEYFGTPSNLQMEMEWLIAPPADSVRDHLPVALDPASNVVAVGGPDGTIHVCNIESGSVRPLHSQHGHSGQVKHVVYCGGGSILVSSAADHTICAWREGTWLGRVQVSGVRGIGISDSGDKVYVISKDVVYCYKSADSLAYDGKFSLGALPRGVRSAAAGDIIVMAHTHWSVAWKSGFDNASVSTDGSRVAVAKRDGRIFIQESLTGNTVGTCRGLESPMSSYPLNFSRCGQFLAAGSRADGRVGVWDLNGDEEPVGFTSAREGRVGDIVVDGKRRRLVASNSHGRISCWSFQPTDRNRPTARWHNGSAAHMFAASDCGSVAAVAWGYPEFSLTLWRCGSDKAKLMSQLPLPDRGGYPSALWIADDKTVFVQYENVQAGNVKTFALNSGFQSWSPITSPEQPQEMESRRTEYHERLRAWGGSVGMEFPSGKVFPIGSMGCSWCVLNGSQVKFLLMEGERLKDGEHHSLKKTMACCSSSNSRLSSEQEKREPERQFYVHYSMYESVTGDRHGYALVAAGSKAGRNPMGAAELVSRPYNTRAEAEEESRRIFECIEVWRADKKPMREFLEAEKLTVSQRTLGDKRRPWAVVLQRCDGRVTWIDANYAVHHATCPVCGGGAELRAYFVGAPECSLDRELSACRIKCDGEANNASDLACSTCTVGTGDISGLYLFPEESCSDSRWTRQVAHEYLTGIGSPLADHPVFSCLDAVT